MSSPEIAILVSTFERPQHLRLSLLSIAGQRGVGDRIEVVVTDDGSSEETRETVADFARHAPFPVTLTTHAHDGFRLAQCRNEGARASRAPYLLFTDGDCLLPPDHVARHLRFRRRCFAVAGDCYRLDRAASLQIGERQVASGDFLTWVSCCERFRLAKKSARAWLDAFLRRPLRPRLTGSNIAVWRGDLERINGFDENYVGWGLEDRDLQRRLARIGVRCRSILGKTAAFHLWHPRHPTYAHNNRDTANLRYYLHGDAPARCRNGLAKIACGELPASSADFAERPPFLGFAPSEPQRLSEEFALAGTD